MSKECADNRQELLSGMMFLSKTNGIEIDIVVFFVKLAIKEMVMTNFNPQVLVAMYQSAESGISSLMVIRILQWKLK